MIPHNIGAQAFIDHVNFMYNDEPTRCRILLAEVLLQLEAQKKHSKLIDTINEVDKMSDDWNKDFNDLYYKIATWVQGAMEDDFGDSNARAMSIILDLQKMI